VHQRPRDHENHEDAREDSDDGHEQASPRSASACAAASEARSRSDVERQPEDEAQPARDTARRDHAEYRRACTRFVPAGRAGSHACIMAGAERKDNSYEAVKKGARATVVAAAGMADPETMTVSWGQLPHNDRDLDCKCHGLERRTFPDGPTRSGNVSIHANV
jgi:hypothetical protein